MKPLTPPVFHILLALADGERHGYAIMQDVLHQTNGQVHLGPGTLYGCLKRMLTAGLVQDLGERAVPGADERRRYYRITGSGREAAAAEMDRMASALEAARIKGVTSFEGGR
ncbi:MAG: PadR family transcriptional regulator [Acidobacteria bacterium]|nr:PadR family transcriptional regulator [Acidobacteriota bacterium]